MSSWPKGLWDKAQLDYEVGTGLGPAHNTFTTSLAQPWVLHTAGGQAPVLLTGYIGAPLRDSHPNTAAVTLETKPYQEQPFIKHLPRAKLHAGSSIHITTFITL